MFFFSVAQHRMTISPHPPPTNQYLLLLKFKDSYQNSFSEHFLYFLIFIEVYTTKLSTLFIGSEVHIH